MPNITVEDAARVAHEVNRAFCAAIGDFSQPKWEDAPDWQKASARSGVEYHVTNPNAKPSDSHDNWLKDKLADNWVWGPTKVPERKEHPCIIPYHELPQDQKIKDYLFIAVVHALL